MYAGERFNSITHLVGTVLAVAGGFILIASVPDGSGVRKTVALTVYAVMLVFLYLSSTLYHSIRGTRAKRFFHVFDHCAIYLLIAGTYTPFTLVTLHGPWGWTLFTIIWALAAGGIAKDVFAHGRFKILSVVLYVVMGWLVIIAFGPLRQHLPSAGLTLLLAGGLVYTAGIVFYALGRRLAYMHGMWHLCVMAGSICHYVAVLRYVAIPA